MGGLVVCLTAANFINPPYPFPFENNLMFVTFTDIQREAAFAADTYDGAVVTTFPMTTALAQPNNGYLMLPHKVLEVPDFRPETMAALKSNPSVMLVYNTEIDPWGVRHTQACQWFFGRYFHYERQMSALELSELFQMRIARIWEGRGFSMSLLVNDQMNGPALLRH